MEHQPWLMCWPRRIVQLIITWWFYPRWDRQVVVVLCGANQTCKVDWVFENAIIRSAGWFLLQHATEQLKCRRLNIWKEYRWPDQLRCPFHVMLALISILNHLIFIDKISGRMLTIHSLAWKGMHCGRNQLRTARQKERNPWINQRCFWWWHNECASH